MVKERGSLLAGRNQVPLSVDEVRRASNTFLGLDKNVNARYEENASTGFWVRQEESGVQYGEIVFGPDIYPGRSVVDPNSALSLDAAAAHELTHYHRWKDKTALPKDSTEHLDDALTSLQAILRYERHLSESDVRQLISDALQRLQLYALGLEDARREEQPEQKMV
jgi:predicted SprT family Zn-dependent metalloprotease